MSNFSINNASGARECFDVVLDKMRAARSANYTITSTDVTNKFSAAVTITWSDAFDDTKYSVSLAVEGVTLNNTSKDNVSVGHFRKTKKDLTVILSVPNSVAGDVVQVHALAIHD